MEAYLEITQVTIVEAAYLEIVYKTMEEHFLLVEQTIQYPEEIVMEAYLTIIIT